MCHNLSSEHVGVLRLALAGDLPDILTPLTSPPSNLAVDLIEIGFLRGDCDFGRGDAVVSGISITLKGRQYLDKLDMPSPEPYPISYTAHRPSPNNSDDIHYPRESVLRFSDKFLGRLAVATIAIILGAFIIYLIAEHTNLLSPIVGKPWN